MGFDAGDSNLYRYLQNRSPNRCDPSGLQLVLPPTYNSGKDLVIQGTIYKQKERQAPPDFSAPQGRFDAEQYWEKIIKGSDEAYAEYKRGCLGLLNLRYGLPSMKHPALPLGQFPQKLFSTYTRAEQFANQQGKGFRIFALFQEQIWDPTTNKPMSQEQFRSLGEVIPTTPSVFGKELQTPGGNACLFRGRASFATSGAFDYASLHKPSTDRKTWFWESMSVSYGGAAQNFKDKKSSSPFPVVIHRPFLDVVQGKNLGDYLFVVFGVVPVGPTAILPPNN